MGGMLEDHERDGEVEDGRRPLSGVRALPLEAVELSLGDHVPAAVGTLVTQLRDKAAAEGVTVDWRTFELGTAHAHEIAGLDDMPDYEPHALVIRVQALSVESE